MAQWSERHCGIDHRDPIASAMLPRGLRWCLGSRFIPSALWSRCRRRCLKTRSARRSISRRQSSTIWCSSRRRCFGSRAARCIGQWWWGLHRSWCRRHPRRRGLDRGYASWRRLRRCRGWCRSRCRRRLHCRSKLWLSLRRSRERCCHRRCMWVRVRREAQPSRRRRLGRNSSNRVPWRRWH